MQTDLSHPAELQTMNERKKRGEKNQHTQWIQLYGLTEQQQQHRHRSRDDAYFYIVDVVDVVLHLNIVRMNGLIIVRRPQMEYRFTGYWTLLYKCNQKIGNVEA